MKVALVAPNNFRDKYCSGLQCIYADLIHQYGLNSTYTSWFLGRRLVGEELILDISYKVPRTYRYVDLGLYALTIQQVRPNYAVLPDVEFSCQKTISVSDQFVLRYAGRPRLIPESVKLVGMVHGTTESEVRSCYKSISPLCQVIGLPGSLEKILPRSDIIKKLRIRKPIILFGIFKDPVTEVPLAKNIIGIVTSLPLKLAYSGRLLSEYKISPKEIQFEMVEEPNPKLAERNVEQFVRMCR